NQLDQPVDENVLVFLVPTEASTDFQLAAWQSLKIGTGGSIGFSYTSNIQVKVQRMDTMSTSKLVNVTPGQVWNAVLDNAGGLTLVQEPKNGPNAHAATKDQCVVFNEIVDSTMPNDAVLIRVMWYVNNSPCVAKPNLNYQSRSVFQLEASLYFSAAEPTDQGFNYTLQQLSNETQYFIPASATDVTVTWKRPGGLSGEDTFTFDPPSEPPPSAKSTARAMRAQPQASA
ncbi:MAG TPA: hypothetical protein VF266_09685, partial [Thermoanaerobaculia bacterium]